MNTTIHNTFLHFKDGENDQYISLYDVLIDGFPVNDSYDRMNITSWKLFQWKDTPRGYQYVEIA